MASVAERIQTKTYEQVYGYDIELTAEEAKALATLLTWGVAFETLKYIGLYDFADALADKTIGDRNFGSLYPNTAQIDREWPHK